MSINHGSIWWNELLTGDVEAAVRYFGSVCGWSFDRMPMDDGEYVVAVAHGKPIAGITDIDTMPELADLGPHWMTYIAVDDTDAAAEQTRFAGGGVIRAPFDVPEVGRVAVVRDPAGAAVGLMTPVFPSDDLVAADRAVDAGADDSDTDENFPV